MCSLSTVAISGGGGTSAISRREQAPYQLGPGLAANRRVIAVFLTKFLPEFDFDSKSEES
jgi:hypothetical protein